jgi:hypothetical protein
MFPTGLISPHISRAWNFVLVCYDEAAMLTYLYPAGLPTFLPHGTTVQILVACNAIMLGSLEAI